MEKVKPTDDCFSGNFNGTAKARQPERRAIQSQCQKPQHTLFHQDQAAAAMEINCANWQLNIRKQQAKEKTATDQGFSSCELSNLLCDAIEKANAVIQETEDVSKPSQQRSPPPPPPN